MATEGRRIAGRGAQPGGIAANDDTFLSLATSVVTGTTNGDWIDLSNYESFEVIAFHTAEAGTPTRCAILVEQASDSSGTGNEAIDGEMEIKSGDLQANGRTPVSNLYAVSAAKPWVRLSGIQAGGTNATLTALVRGIARKYGTPLRYLTEGTKVATGAASY